MEYWCLWMLESVESWRDWRITTFLCGQEVLLKDGNEDSMKSFQNLIPWINFKSMHSKIGDNAVVVVISEKLMIFINHCKFLYNFLFSECISSKEEWGSYIGFSKWLVWLRGFCGNKSPDSMQCLWEFLRSVEVFSVFQCCPKDFVLLLHGHHGGSHMVIARAGVLSSNFTPPNFSH